MKEFDFRSFVMLQHKNVQDANTVYFSLLCTLLTVIIYFRIQFCLVFAQ